MGERARRLVTESVQERKLVCSEEVFYTRCLFCELGLGYRIEKVARNFSIAKHRASCDCDCLTRELNYTEVTMTYVPKARTKKAPVGTLTIRKVLCLTILVRPHLTLSKRQPEQKEYHKSSDLMMSAFAPMSSTFDMTPLRSSYQAHGNC